MVYIHTYMHTFIYLFIYIGLRISPLPVAARSKAWVCNRSPAGIAGSNAAGGMSVVLCVVRHRPLRRAGHRPKSLTA